MDLQDSYLSVNESLVHGGIRNDCEVEVIHIDAEDIGKDGPEKHLGDLNAYSYLEDLVTEERKVRF